MATGIELQFSFLSKFDRHNVTVSPRGLASPGARARARAQGRGGAPSQLSHSSLHVTGARASLGRRREGVDYGLRAGQHGRGCNTQPPLLSRSVPAD